MGESAENRSGSSSSRRRDLGPRGGNRLPEQGSSLVWSVGGFGITPEAVRRRTRYGVSLRSVVDEVAHLGLLVVDLGIHDNEEEEGYFFKNSRERVREKAGA